MTVEIAGDRCSAIEGNVASRGAAYLPDVLHLVYREGLASVFEAMVVKPMARLRERGMEVRLGIFTPVGEFYRSGPRRRWRERMSYIRNNFRGQAHRIPSPPSRMRWLWNEAAYFKRWVRSQYDSHRPLIVHCRGAEAANLGMQLRSDRPNTRVLFDMRGVAHAEYVYERGYREMDDVPDDVRRVTERLLALELHVAQAADAMICVSSAMARFAIERFGVPREKIAVMSCAADTDGQDPMVRRQEVRKTLGLSNRFVVAFCGGAQSWQLPDDCAHVYKTIRGIVSSSHYLVLTPSPDKMREVLRRAGLSEADAMVMKIPHSEVPAHLAAADLGLLLRERCLVNEVASPVKFGEY